MGGEGGGSPPGRDHICLFATLDLRTIFCEATGTPVLKDSYVD